MGVAHETTPKQPQCDLPRPRAQQSAPPCGYQDLSKRARPPLACDVVPRLSMLRALRAAPALSRRYAGLLHSSGPPRTKPRWTKAASRRCRRAEAARTCGLVVAEESEERPRAMASRMRERPSHASSMACNSVRGVTGRGYARCRRGQPHSPATLDPAVTRPTTCPPLQPLMDRPEIGRQAHRRPQGSAGTPCPRRHPTTSSALPPPACRAASSRYPRGRRPSGRRPTSRGTRLQTRAAA